MATHIRDVPTSLATKATGVPAALASIVDRALAKDPGARPSSAAEIVQALDDVSGSRIVRRRPAVPRTAVVALAVAGLMAVTAVVLPRRQTGAVAESRPTGALARSIAVLPFENTSTDTSDVYFAEGMSDELSTA